MGTPQQVLQIDPAEVIRFNGLFTEIVTSELKLANPTDDQVAFKVKTTAPRRYAVRPNSGVLNAGESVVVSVMRQPFEFDPAERVRHKFMIQSVRMQPGQTLNTIWTEVDSTQLMDTRLRVQFDDIPPSNRSSITDEEYHKVRDENDRLSKEVDDLKSERQRLRNLAMSDNSGAARIQLPKGLSLIFHEKKNVFLIFLLLIVCFTGGLFLADKILTSPASPAEN